MMSSVNQIISMTPRQLENGDWKIVGNALIEAKQKLNCLGFGNQSWLDAPIAISIERGATEDANPFKEFVCRLIVALQSYNVAKSVDGLLQFIENQDNLLSLDLGDGARNAKIIKSFGNMDSDFYLRCVVPTARRIMLNN